MGYALGPQFLKINACLSQHLYAFRHQTLPLKVELEMELPGGVAGGQCATRVAQGESHLYQFGPLDVVPGVLVVQFLLRVVV